MRHLTFAAALGATAALAFGAQAEPVTGTSGPYPVVMEQDPRLPDHTLYRPADMRAVKGPLPFIAFGNGGCFNSGVAFKALLGEVASRGYVVTAPGPMTPPPRPDAAATGAPRVPPAQSKPRQMATAIDWAERVSKTAGGAYSGRLDVSRIAVMGQSCGGLEAIGAAKDPRVTTVLVLNSGIIRGGIPSAQGADRAPPPYLPAVEADLPGIHTPIVYLIGGPKDQAYRGAEADFQAINRVPLFNANLDVGHGGTWRDPQGGEMGKVAISWLDWRLKGDAAASKLFTGADCGLCKDPKWTVKRKNID